MSLFKGMLVAVSVLSLAGCSTVYSTKPMGEKIVAAEPEEWEGTWINSEMNMVSIKVIDAKKGILKSMWIENMKMESCEFQLLESGTWMFGSTKKDDKDNRYIWGRIKKDAGQLGVITSDDKGILFEWTNPIILIRLSK